MARGPDGSGGGAGFSLADQLFNAGSLADLARAHAILPGFDPDRFLGECLPRLPALGLLERLDWIADCLSRQLPRDFPAMAEALEAAMPPRLDPTRTDDDFGRFIHAVPGVLAVRHGLDSHRERALDLLHAATQRFSMEFYIRPFLNRWPQETLARLDRWAVDDNYHVRRLVSEGTRPRLPWARGIDIDPRVPLRFLDVLHGDPTRFVTRSVANHLNDISRIDPEAVTGRLRDWARQARQDPKELEWMTRHALRTAVKRGERGALDLLGYGGRFDGAATLDVLTPRVAVGEALRFAVTLAGGSEMPVMIDYRLRFARPNGRTGEKVFKLKVARTDGRALRLEKRHALKAGATTFTWHPGPHRIIVQVNGRDVAEGGFDVIA